MLQKCEGIIIKTSLYGESNKIVTIFSREFGKVGVMARGANKPSSRLRAITQLFTYGNFLFQSSSGLGLLQQGEIINSYRRLKEDIVLTAYASYIAELTDKITEEKKPEPFLYEMVFQIFQYINEGMDAQILTFIYEIKAIRIMGLYMNVDGCSNCGTKESNFSFSIREGGFLCEACRQYDPHTFIVSQQAIKLLRLFYYFELNRLGNISVKDSTKKELKMIIDHFMEEYSGLYIKSKKFLNQLDLLT